jgi:hypothetical protein
VALGVDLVRAVWPNDPPPGPSPIAINTNPTVRPIHHPRFFSHRIRAFYPQASLVVQKQGWHAYFVRVSAKRFCRLLSRSLLHRGAIFDG